MATAPELPFQVVIDDHGPGLYRHLVGVLGPHDGADCYQEAVVAALRAWPPRHDGNLRAWLFTIAHRKVIDAARARSRRPVPVAELPAAATEMVEVGGDGGDPWAAVRRLPAKQRVAVALRHGEDWAYPDIAAALGCSEAAARQSVKAGLDRLRQEGWS